MAIDQALVDLMLQTVTIYTRTARDGYGKPTWDAGTAISAHIVQKQRMAVDAQGQEVSVRGDIYTNYTTEIDPDESTVTLGGGSRKIRIVDTAIHYDDEGDVHHQVISYGSFL